MGAKAKLRTLEMAWLIGFRKRIFLLGPSHHFYLKGCALSQCTHYSTPLGDLKLDLGTIDELQQMGKFSKMSQDVDEDEHSLEMHLPYIYQMLSKSFSRPADFPALIPILVGNTTPSKEREYGSILAPYLQDPTSIFIVSSDFCHWGLRFGYTYYLPQATTRLIEGIKLSATSKLGQGCQISESIDRLDHITMEAIESGDHSAFTQILQSTGNTVCGRHPIGIAMCALESLHKDQSSTGCPSPFRFIRYEQSSRCAKVGDSSVSYASAFAAVQGRTRDALGD